MKLSIAMIVRNEEKYIENTLKPLRQLENYIDTEIIIVDTGSTDKTVEIAKKYTDKIYFHQWNDNFGDMRNKSINYCTGDWIMVVDADEVLYDVEELGDLLKSKRFIQHNSALIKIINFNKSIENSIKNGYISPLLRLFKKDTVKYEGVVHEQPQIKHPIIDTNIRFVHYGYNSSDYELMEYKFQRNIKLLLEELKTEPDNIYINFQIAVSYDMHNDLNEALKYIEISYNKAKGQLDNFIYVLDKYCFILYKLKEYSSLIPKIKQGIKYRKDFLDFYFYLGEAYYNLGKKDDAIKAYKKYLYYFNKLKENLLTPCTTLSILTRGHKDNVLYNLALCYYKNKCYQNALATIMKVENKDLLKDKTFFILKIIVEGKLWNEIGKIDDFVDKLNYETILTYIHKEVSLKDLEILSKMDLNKELREIIFLVYSFRKNGKLEPDSIIIIKDRILQSKIPYFTYVYYLLKHDIIEESRFFVSYGKSKFENILLSLCREYFDFNGILLEALKKIKPDNFTNVIIRIIMQKTLLLSGKLPLDKRKELFLTYIAESYYSILKTYNKHVIEDNDWMLSSEERFIVKLKGTLQKKYENSIEYIKSIKEILQIEKSYVNYIKLLIEEQKQYTANDEIRAFIPELVNSIQGLINSEKYQEAYNTINEGLDLVKFDFDLMVIKYSLLLKFNYEEESMCCLQDIILYGQEKKVKKFVKEFLN
ncbi:glycosyltransferase [Oceanirhabdus seepicola]|uniref:Glycosyltransferase n=2 Tax=Oceanirhabdus seepicola TaxID=2828781 RepID=A0A9J6PCA1_9CLOT|nr:glycosyltransferase [Oceanirhabdus seepicola]